MHNGTIDMTGMRFGKIVVIKPSHTYRKPSGQTVLYWECKCDCGKTFCASGSNLRNGHYMSCGCVREEKRKEGQLRKTHGMAGTRIYNIWSGMKKRCDNPKHKHYSRYGGRGITYCKEWASFETFRDWALSNGYADNLTLDRIDNDGDYKPSNCRWVSRQTQANNKSTNINISIDGITHTVTEWARIYGIESSLALHRLAEGWDEKDIFKQPTKITKRQLITYNNKTQCASAWGRELGISAATIIKRLNKGLPIEECLSTNLKGRNYITYNGKTQSITDWSKEVGINRWVLSSRINNGWDIEKALFSPIETKYSHKKTIAHE